MTKAEEIKLLEETIKKFGQDSYLGPFLREIRNELESNIRSDIFPSITMAEAAKGVAQILDSAETKAKGIVAKAQQEADAAQARMGQEVQAVRARVGEAQRAMNTLLDRI